MTAGYYRFPTIHNQSIVFVSEDDLWHVSVEGGIARRLTSNLGYVTYPMYSPDGSQLAFVGREAGYPEVYVMSSQGGTAERLTYQSSECRILGWTADSRHIVFCSNYGQAHASDYVLYCVAADSASGVCKGEAELLPYGPARAITYGPGGAAVLGRNTGDPARWKRYRGGTTGHLWIDRAGDGEFVPYLADVEGNIASPMWIHKENDPGRIYFVSDHEGIGNLYSALPDGSHLMRHTDHDDFYARNPTTDGRRIVYHAGSDLWVYDVETAESCLVPVEYYSPRVQRNRKFVSAGAYIDSAALSPKGTALALTTRGKAFAMYNHDGAVLQLGKVNGVRYRLADWLNDGQRLIVVSDEPGEEVLEIYSREPGILPRRLNGVEFGRAVELQVSPTEDKIALTNHRHELLVVDLEKETATVVDRSLYHQIAGFDWSPDGRWIVYGFCATHQTTELRLYRFPDPDANGSTSAPGEGVAGHTSATFSITSPVLHDARPTFDPDGKFIYFISYREFNPVYDSVHFDLGFPQGARPYLLTLQSDQPNPFVPHPDIDELRDEDDEADGGNEDDWDEDGLDEEDLDEGEEYDSDLDDSDLVDDEEWRRSVPCHETTNTPTSRPGYSSDTNGVEPADGDRAGRQENGRKEDGRKEDGRREDETKSPRPVHIDLDGIQQRILPFPVPEGRYGDIMGLPDRAIFTVFAVQGSLGSDYQRNYAPGIGAGNSEEDAESLLQAYDFKQFRTEMLAEGVDWFDLSRNRKKLLYGRDSRLRVITAGEKAPGNSGPSRKSGWISLGRVKVSIDPQSEWEQMFREAWRLQRDQFWTEDMSDVDWQTVYERYFPLIQHVSSRTEFSDLMWEMQGELGTSHAYEFGGDYRPRPIYRQGFLGAEITWDEEAEGYRLQNFIQGDPWDRYAHSPLAAPGVSIAPGDVLVAINGQPLTREYGPTQLLVNQAGEDVLLTLKPTQQDERAENPAGTKSPQPAPDSSDTVTPSGEDSTVPETTGPCYKTVTVHTLYDEREARYRAWVNRNRKLVYQATNARVGYVHIPDMGPKGYAEFHRSYLSEVDKDALIVDVRYNGGGHVSALIIEKLARRRLGYDMQRWGGYTPYPMESVAGPLVLITNEHAGSDGDVFCHSFKMMGLGPLIGKRTWGGVVGIWPRHALVDGTVTTQPEFGLWFQDVGWNVENYGTEPDIEVDIRPQDYREGRDTQLDQAIEEILGMLAATPPMQPPDLSSRPSRALPKLPPR